MESAKVSRCVTCGSELHPERAAKYDYCMAPECQEKNARGLTMVAVGINKSAEQYLIREEDPGEDRGGGKSHDRGGGSFGPPAPRSPAGTPARRGGASQPARRPSPPARRPARTAPRAPRSKSQEKLALLYNEQGIRPDEIAQKLGLSRYLVTQIILAARNRGKL